MALFSATYGAAPDFNVHAVQGGNAAELTTNLTAEIAAAVAASEGNIVDINVAAAGAGPMWQAWFVTANVNSGTPNVSLNLAVVFAAVAGNPTQAEFLLNQQLSESPLTLSQISKISVAGAGLGPTYMALALAKAGGG